MNFATATATLSAPTAISVANFVQACGACVPQTGTSQTLDTLSDRVMYRFAVRHFADHDRAVVNHAVASGSQVAVRWYELFDPAGSVTVNQQGTFAPDTTYRWMASIAEDKNGDIGMGYSASSTSIHPAIRFTGRVPSDASGTMETEASILEGTGSQSGNNLARWGDYTALQVDPSDDCTFWYVDQYEKTTGSFNWSTNIGSWVFNGCSGGGGGPIVSLSATKLTFAKTPIGQTSPSKSVTLTNTGTATLNISSVTISGDFAIKTNTCGAQVQPGANCKVTMAFTPTAKGARQGTLSFTDDAPGSPQTVALNGTGESIALSPNPVNYGTVVVGQSSTMAVTVKNVGPATVSLTGFSITGETSDFSITANTCGGTIAPGATCSISVKFAPTVKGKRSGKLNVFNNGGGSDSTDKLVGTGG
jgi:ASPM-SPD-2-Hydin domain-containing protein